MALQKWGIEPENVIILNVRDSTSQLKVKNNLIAHNTTLYGPELDRVSENAVKEYHYHKDQLKRAFGDMDFIHEEDSNLIKDEVI